MTERACPICRRPVTVPAHRPFCSKRCGEVDLQRWFSGAYAVPSETGSDDLPAGPGEPLDG